MDNYQIQKTEPRGSHGFVHIVKRIRDGTTFAMKVVECMDEATANRAMEEAMIILKLDHPNICHYEEIFVSWDHEVSAVTVCMVMDYSPVGDLASVIQTKRQMKGKIREMVIKNFLGQMVDGLIYLQSKHVIHRNLKPTNIQMLADLSFTICDFIFPTFVGDEVKFKIRMKDSAKVWMAPEALKRRPLAKSDVWSLGCILLEMMTCNMMDVQNPFPLHSL
ncbi:serine/threonine kinase-like domain-containing protein STKLD1 isoform X1 [Hemiscyllium ocellatum]|uniref:serine/threonine kinase-like domain-containing protein STKLD1 isoform X1 n=1 Tax=Hemiscyllium ocellatum TaxID=170820 RepID=UPI0029676D6A|nr:serine/threonine kinase-like domain-containing protein STKLD1 isoform X1 [Hemiscyllium ocellatum]